VVTTFKGCGRPCLHRQQSRGDYQQKKRESENMSFFYAPDFRRQQKLSHT
jgi:hypothetical protein